MIGVVWAVAWRIVATLWSLASLTLVALVVGAVRRERRQKRADVRAARARGRALWLEQSAVADWAAVQAAVNGVHREDDQRPTDAHFAAWDAQFADGGAA